MTRGVYVAVAGDARVTLAKDDDEFGDSVLFPGLLAGQIYELRVKRLWNADTSATLIGLY